MLCFLIRAFGPNVGKKRWGTDQKRIGSTCAAGATQCRSDAILAAPMFTNTGKAALCDAVSRWPSRALQDRKDPRVIPPNYGISSLTQRTWRRQSAGKQKRASAPGLPA